MHCDKPGVGWTANGTQQEKWQKIYDEPELLGKLNKAGKESKWM